MSSGKSKVADITPAEALVMLKEGNFRFLNNMPVNKDLLGAVDDTKDGQSPYAVILSCMDSRTSAELVFDQGVGDVFSIRIAGNIVSDGILGSLEYAAAVAGSKLIVVMGHTNCGAIKGACDRVELGHITYLLAQIEPAIQKANKTHTVRNSKNDGYVAAVTKFNVEHSIEEILNRSTIIRDMVIKGDIAIVPSMYDVATGKVIFSGFEVQVGTGEVPGIN
jgi:carbonic anhydrase